MAVEQAKFILPMGNGDIVVITISEINDVTLSPDLIILAVARLSADLLTGQRDI